MFSPSNKIGPDLHGIERNTIDLKETQDCLRKQMLKGLFRPLS